MADTLHIIGNGPSSSYYDANSKGVKLTCNIPPFPVRDAYATVIVDFKMMNAIHHDGIGIPSPWVLGFRPKLYMEKNPSFHIRAAPHIREFYTHKPPYVAGYTDFNCGHMATHYGVAKFDPKEVHMYGFNSMFDFDLSSATDFYLESDRSEQNNTRLTKNWRAIWEKMFDEFSDVKFYLHGEHTKLKFSQGKNVEIVVH